MSEDGSPRKASTSKNDSIDGKIVHNPLNQDLYTQYPCLAESWQTLGERLTNIHSKLGLSLAKISHSWD